MVMISSCEVSKINEKSIQDIHLHAIHIHSTSNSLYFLIWALHKKMIVQIYNTLPFEAPQVQVNSHVTEFTTKFNGISVFHKNYNKVGLTAPQNR